MKLPSSNVCQVYVKQINSMFGHGSHHPHVISESICKYSKIEKKKKNPNLKHLRFQASGVKDTRSAQHRVRGKTQFLRSLPGTAILGYQLPRCSNLSVTAGKPKGDDPKANGTGPSR